jgi:ribosomal protein S27E
MQPANFRALALSGNPLLIRCRGCGHRAVIAAERIGASPHSMESIETPRFSCEVCRGHDIERKITYGAPTVEDGSVKTGSSRKAVTLEESPYTHARYRNCEEVREVKFERIGKHAPTDIVCKTCHFVIAMLCRAKPVNPPRPPSDP